MTAAAYSTLQISWAVPTHILYRSIWACRDVQIAVNDRLATDCDVSRHRDKGVSRHLSSSAAIAYLTTTYTIAPEQSRHRHWSVMSRFCRITNRLVKGASW